MFLCAKGNKVVRVEALQSLLVAHRGTHCKHKCSKHGTRGAKFALQQGTLPMELLSFGLPKCHPVVRFWWFCVCCTKLVACGNKHPWQTFWLTVVGNCLRQWQFVLALGVEKCHPVVRFWFFVGKFQVVGKSVRVGCLGKLQSKSHPVVAKTHFLLAVVGQSGGKGAIGCHCKNTHTGWAFSPFRTWAVVCRLGAGGRFFLPPCRCCIDFVGQFARHLGQVARQCGAHAPRWACRLWKTCKFQK